MIAVFLEHYNFVYFTPNARMLNTGNPLNTEINNNKKKILNIAVLTSILKIIMFYLANIDLDHDLFEYKCLKEFIFKEKAQCLIPLI